MLIIHASEHGQGRVQIRNLAPSSLARLAPVWPPLWPRRGRQNEFPPLWPRRGRQNEFPPRTPE
jgi:hypothetical protein